MGLIQSINKRIDNVIPKGKEEDTATSSASSDDTPVNVTFQVSNVKIGNRNKARMKKKLQDLNLIDPGAHSEYRSTKKLVSMKNERGGSRHVGIDALLLAFDEHLPLSLRPDFFWFLILQGVNLHISKNPEKLRKKFVSFEGKKELCIRRDDLTLGNPENQWDTVVQDFLAQIKANTVQGVVEKVAADFTTSTYIDVIASAVTTMSFTQHFFDFKCSTMCGFPSITLEGRKADWEHLIAKTHELLTLCDKNFAKQWKGCLLPILDRFVKQFENPGAVDVKFWESMCKKDGRRGSGGYDWISGWINAFIPFEAKTGQPNFYCVPYDETCDYHAKRGMDIAEMPRALTSAPVTWDYLGSKRRLEFVSGFIGIEQEIDTGVIKPLVGWYIKNAEEGT